MSEEASNQSIIAIKNMVSRSCVRLVKQLLQGVPELTVERVSLGKARVRYEGDELPEKAIEEVLEEEGFELLKDPEAVLVEQIKNASIELIHFASNANSLIRNSDYLSDKLGHPYSKLSKLFSERTGTTLERYLILLKIEKVKELVSYGEHTLSEIAYLMGYSSVHYLSNQFKQVTGVSVSEYKKSPDKERKPLEELL